MSAAIFWVFVVLAHPTSMSGPYPTQATCEAARARTFDPGATTGCHLTTRAVLDDVATFTVARAPKPAAARRR